MKRAALLVLLALFSAVVYVIGGIVLEYFRPYKKIRINTR